MWRRRLDAATRATVTLAAGETDYQTIAPATTTTTVPGEVAAGAEQEYTVQAGDYGIKVANQFGVSLEDLQNVNGWSDASKEFPGPGAVIKIPAGGTVGRGATPAPTTDATDADAATDAGGDTGEAIPDPGSNCEAGSHTVVSGDIPLKLVEQYDVTLEALEAGQRGQPRLQPVHPGREDHHPRQRRLLMSRRVSEHPLNHNWSKTKLICFTVSMLALDAAE